MQKACSSRATKVCNLITEINDGCYCQLNICHSVLENHQIPRAVFMFHRAKSSMPRFSTTHQLFYSTESSHTQVPDHLPVQHDQILPYPGSRALTSSTRPNSPIPRFPITYQFHTTKSSHTQGRDYFQLIKCQLFVVAGEFSLF